MNAQQMSWTIKYIIFIYFPNVMAKCGDSLVGRASDWRSEGHVFEPRSPQKIFREPFEEPSWSACHSMTMIKSAKSINLNI